MLLYRFAPTAERGRCLVAFCSKHGPEPGQGDLRRPCSATPGFAGQGTWPEAGRRGR